MNQTSGSHSPLEAKANMRHRSLLIAAIIWSGFTACGRGAPETAPPQQHSEELAETPAEVQSAGGEAAGLVGDWELQSNPPQRLPGLHLTVTVDSTAGSRYFGQLSNYFSGDVGIDPRDFEAFADSIWPDGSLTFALPTVDRAMIGILLKGTYATDTIQLSTFVLGPDTLSTGTRRWALVRGR
jgi:hypothetical protein